MLEHLLHMQVVLHLVHDPEASYPNYKNFVFLYTNSMQTLRYFLK